MNQGRLPKVPIEEIAGLCQREWGLGQINAVVRLEKQPGSAALYRVFAEDGRFLFKEHLPLYKLGDLERIALTADFLADRAFPTPRYRRTRDGRVAADVRGALCSLRPWVEGEPLARDTLTTFQMGRLGQTLGWCHRLLAPLPKGREFRWDTDLPDVIRDLDELSARIVVRPDPAETDGQALEAIATKRATLQRATGLSALFATCPTQVIHGDYYLDNVLFDDEEKLTGVIDFEGWTNHRALEVFRAIAWSQQDLLRDDIDLSLAWAFVSAYQEEEQLTADELRVGPELLRWRLERGINSLRAYAMNPTAQSLGLVIERQRLAQWLGQNGRELGEELAVLGR